ncbi:MAG: 1-acyl-sn-glycerol-3-phosphate acyltransferase [Prevotellaceae bacterium]|jgi:1-acyl-sn-glycerol-3-phosphate acyltransferase|nr:1-acyl-sn-glycerol-3-phosphate acyltransferase [Prevotellaceae bacterium]
MRQRSKTNLNFKDIDKVSWRYWLLYVFQSFVYRRIYYREYRVVGYKNVPKRNVPTLMVCNHQNGLNDALNILCAFRDFRQPTFIARADMFKKPLVVAILKFLKIMPAFRPRDGEDPTKNEEIFNASADVLSHRHTLVLFPEGLADKGHYISMFRKGFARSAFRAEERNDFKLGVKIVPVCNHYSGYYNFREKVTLVIGEPVDLSDYFELYKQNPEKAQLELSRDMHDRVQAMMLDIRPQEDYEKLNLLRKLYTRRYLKKHGLRASYFPNHLTADKATISALEKLKESNPEKHTKLLNSAQEMLDGMEKLNLRSWLFTKPKNGLSLFFDTKLFVLLFPLYLASYLSNMLPYKSCEKSLKIVKDKVLLSSFTFVLGGLILYPIYATLLGVTLSITLSSIWALFAMYILLFFSTLFFWSYKKGMIKLRARWRFNKLKKRKNADLMYQLKLHKEIVDELDAIIL